MHYFTALPVVAIWLHAIFLATRRPFSWRPWLLVHAGIALLYSPWIGPALAQFERGQPWWRREVGWDHIPGYAADLLRELTFGIYGVPIVGTVTGAVGICVLGIGLVGIAAAIVRKLEERDVFVALIALTPVLLGLALLPVTGHMELSRYLSYATPLLFLAAARGLGSFGLRPRDVIAILVIGSVAMLPSLRTYYLSPAKDSDPRPIEAYLRDAARPEPEAPDTIFVAPGYMTAVLRGESRGNLEYRRLSGDADLRRVLADAPSPHHATWLIVDYRWPGFNEISRDDRVTEAHVPSGMPGRIKLFRVLPR